MARQIAHSFARQRTSRQIVRRIAPLMAADCSALRASMAFTMVFAPYFSVDGSGLLILPLVNGFHEEFPAVLHSGWRGGSLILSVVNGFHDGLRTVLLGGWQWIAHTSTRPRLSQRFTCGIARRMAADCSFFLSSTAFMTVSAPYCSVDGNALLISPLVHGFPDGSHAILLTGWRRIAHSFSRQQLSRQFLCHIAPQIAADCLFFQSSTVFMTVCTPYCSADGSGLLGPLLSSCFHDGFHAMFLSGWQQITHSSTRQ